MSGPPLMREAPSLSNRLLQSESLATSPWVLDGNHTTTGISVTPGQADPFGTTRASLLTAITAPARLQQNFDRTNMVDIKGQVVASGATARIIFTFWAQAGTLNTFLFQIFDNISLVAQERFIYLSSVWKRYKLSIGNIDPSHVTTATLYPGSGANVAGTVYLFGPQISDFDSDYIPTTTAAVADSADGMRLERGLIAAGGIALPGGPVRVPATGTITGNGTTTAFTITHNLGKASPAFPMIAQFFLRTGTDQQTFPLISARTANSFTATFPAAPAGGVLIDWEVV